MRIQVKKPVGFSLAAASAFYESFTPGSGMAAADATRLTLAFRLDGTFEAVAVAFSESADAITLDVAGTSDEARIVRQVTRILGLDADGEAWRDVGRRDPVVGRLQREFPGFFTAAKSSPYDAATWGVIAPRLSIPAAAKIKMRIARAYGDAVAINDQVHFVFPSPRALKALSHIEGLADEKVARLHAVADAALEGRLDADRLRALTPDAALADLQTLRGVGPWTAGHIYFRGAAPTDALPTVEPRVVRGWGSAAGVTDPTESQLARAAEAWRPFRMWVSILLSRHLARSGGWNAPGLAEERARAIRRASRSTASMAAR
jgi:DNA-3-methyladenine glycosylase II